MVFVGGLVQGSAPPCRGVAIPGSSPTPGPCASSHLPCTPSSIPHRAKSKATLLFPDAKQATPPHPTTNSYLSPMQQFDMTLHTIVDRELLAANGLTTGNNNGNGGGGSSGGGLSSGALAAIIVCSSVAGLAIIFTLLLVAYERRGRPLFGQPLLQHQSMSTEFSTVHLPLPPPNK